jgi:urease accessory protein
MWLLLQISDAAFPAGGFAHSSGLEAAMHLGGEIDLDAFLEQTLCQTGRFALPFVRAAFERPLAEIDAICDASILSHVANRASRAQGRAFASAASRIWDDLTAIKTHAEVAPAHFAPIFGAVSAARGLRANDAAMAFLHTTARGVLSAAVRLGAIGPLEAQRVHHAALPLLESLLATHTHLDDAAQTAPLLELYGALHDQLDGRLFQS